MEFILDILKKKRRRSIKIHAAEHQLLYSSHSAWCFFLPTMQLGVMLMALNHWLKTEMRSGLMSSFLSSLIPSPLRWPCLKLQAPHAGATKDPTQRLHVQKFPSLCYQWNNRLDKKTTVTFITLGCNCLGFFFLVPLVASICWFSWMSSHLHSCTGHLWLTCDCF